MDNRDQGAPPGVLVGKTGGLSDSLLSSDGFGLADLAGLTPSSDGSTFHLIDCREKGSREADADGDKENSTLYMSATSDDAFSFSGDIDSLIFKEALALAEEFATMAREGEDDPPATADSGQRLSDDEGQMSCMLASGAESAQPEPEPPPSPPSPLSPPSPPSPPSARYRAPLSAAPVGEMTAPRERDECRGGPTGSRGSQPRGEDKAWTPPRGEDRSEQTARQGEGRSEQTARQGEGRSERTPPRTGAGPADSSVPPTAAAAGVSPAYAALCERASAELRQLEQQTQEEYECLQFEAMERSLSSVPPPAEARRRPQLTPWDAAVGRPNTGTFKVNKSRYGTYRVARPGSADVQPPDDAESPQRRAAADVRLRRPTPGRQRLVGPVTPGLNRTFGRDARLDRTWDAESPASRTGRSEAAQLDSTFDVDPACNGGHVSILSGSCDVGGPSFLDETFDVNAPVGRFSESNGQLNQTFNAEAPLNDIFATEVVGNVPNGGNDILNRTFEAKMPLKQSLEAEATPDRTVETANPPNQRHDAVMRPARKSDAHSRQDRKSDTEVLRDRTIDTCDLSGQRTSVYEAPAGSTSRSPISPPSSGTFRRDQLPSRDATRAGGVTPAAHGGGARPAGREQVSPTEARSSLPRSDSAGSAGGGWSLSDDAAVAAARRRLPGPLTSTPARTGQTRPSGLVRPAAAGAGPPALPDDVAPSPRPSGPARPAGLTRSSGLARPAGLTRPAGLQMPRATGLRPPAAAGVRPPAPSARPRPPASGPRPPASGLRPPVSGMRPPVSGLRPPAPGPRPPTPGLRPPTSGSRVLKLAPDESGVNVPTNADSRPAPSDSCDPSGATSRLPAARSSGVPAPRASGLPTARRSGLPIARPSMLPGPGTRGNAGGIGRARIPSAPRR